MKIYLGIKYRKDLSNKILVERIVDALERHQVYCVHKDLEKWNKVEVAIGALMEKTFEKIEESDLVLIEFSEKGVGLGIESGYAKALGKPIIVLHKKGTEVSPTLVGTASEIVEYENLEKALISIKALSH